MFLATSRVAAASAIQSIFSRRTMATSSRINSLAESNKLLELDGMKEHAKLRVEKVAGHMTEILELRSEKPSFQVLFIPGNPGIVSFYKDYIEALYQMLDRKATVTAIGHLAQSLKDWENGRLFSLQEQIDHKVEFIREELLPQELPIFLVGHSIGSYISLEIFKDFPGKISFMIGMYPFLTINKNSLRQLLIKTSVRYSIICSLLSSIAALVGKCPIHLRKHLFRLTVGSHYSSNAIDVVCNYLTKYNVIQNIAFMGMTEFSKLKEQPDWEFIRNKKGQLAFLFGIDDHWGPLTLFEEISSHVSEIDLQIEKEGHMHAFCCTKAGSIWVADYSANIIKKQVKE